MCSATGLRKVWLLSFGNRRNMSMKTFFMICLFAFATISLPANAGLAGKGGVKDIYNNGKIRGNPSYLIECYKGSRVVVRVSDRWTDRLGYSFSNTFKEMNIHRFAKDLCHGQLPSG